MKIRFQFNSRLATLLLLAILSLTSCNKNNKENTEHNSASSQINLNDGDKWKVNSEMTPFIEKGEDLLGAYVAKQDADYTLLAENLKVQNDLLIKSCTMKGESHDELHKWLYPHLELVSQLQKSEDKEQAKAIVTKLQRSFTLYHKHFE